MHHDRRGHRYGGACFERSEKRHWTAAAVAVAAVGVAVSAYAASESAHQAQQQSDYNKKVTENQLMYQQEQGRLAAEGEALRQKRVMAAQHAAFASAGVDTTEGTPLVVAMDSANLAARDLQLLKYGSDIRASGFAAQAGLQGNLASMYGRQRATGAGVSLLGGAGAIATSYLSPYRYGQNPAPASTITD